MHFKILTLFLALFFLQKPAFADDCNDFFNDSPFTGPLVHQIPAAVKKSFEASAVTNVGPFSASGFFINDSKTFVTNFHIVREALTAQETDPLHQAQSSLNLDIIQNGHSYSVKRVKNISVPHDLAVLEVEDYDGEFLKLSNNPHPPERVYAVGFPKPKPRIIEANVWDVQDKHFEYSIFTHFGLHLIIRGVSGGPIVNHHGDVVGVISGLRPWLLYAVKPLFLKQLLAEDLSPSSDVIHLIQDQVQLMYDLADKGDPMAQYNLGTLLDREFFKINMLEKVKTLKNERDLKQFQNDEAWRWLEEAAKKGHLQAAYGLGSSLFKNRKFYKKGFKWIEKAAEAGDSHSQYILSHLLQSGIGTERSIYEAFSWLKKAADQNHPQSMFELGVEYMQIWAAKGGPSYKKKALSWFERSADRGDVLAKFTLALMYLTGSGVSKDVEKAMEYLIEAAQAGHDHSQFLLGILYKTGIIKGVNKNETLGNAWLEESQFSEWINPNNNDFKIISKHKKQMNHSVNEWQSVFPKWGLQWTIFKLGGGVLFQLIDPLYFLLETQKVKDWLFVRWAVSKKITKPMDPMRLIQMVQRTSGFPAKL